MKLLTKAIYDVVRNERQARLHCVEPFKRYFENRLKSIQARNKGKKK